MTDLPNNPPPSQRPTARDALARAVAIVAVAATVVTGWFAWEARQALGDMQSSAGGRIAELGAAEAQSRAGFAQLQSAMKDAQSRISELEARVADTQEQRVALEEMYRELSRSADDRVLSEVEQMLVLASQQLQLAGNVRGALAALQAADQRLARADKLASTPLRRAITQDMDKLKAVPQVDTVGIAVKLDALIAQSDSLPLPIAEAAPARVASRAYYTDEPNGVSRAARDFWEEMKNLVRIRDMEAPDAVLLSPPQAYFLRENLKLRLLSARVALLARDEPSFREDLKSCQAWVAKYFDPRAKATIATVASLKQVAESPVSIAAPDINASLAAVRSARTAREKR
ncbi:MAG TPA: uroporphyrinogen-III C-methyltransferase [Usitatibacter sp.]|nr:uroporphyrinogen-III C-methyltransferase [Usitatibacter sp.]